MTQTLSLPAETLLAYIRANDYVTYVEAEKVLSPHMTTMGDWAITHQDIENLLFWSGVSKAFLDVLGELFDAGVIYRVPADRLSYLIDGGGLNLPSPKRVQRRYAKPHWIPTCLRLTELVSLADRKRYAHKPHAQK